MELIKAACETCGGKLELNENRTAAKCVICGNVYFIKNAASCGTNLTALLIRAQLSVEEMDFAEAENICEKIEALNDELPELWLYLLLIEAKAPSLENLYDTEKDYTESNNYTKALYYAYSSQKDSCINDLEELKNKRIEKLKGIIKDNPDLAESALAKGEALSFLEANFSSKKGKGGIYIHDKTEYIHCGRLQFYNIAVLKFELNKSIGLFKEFELEKSKIKKCYSRDAIIDIPFGIEEIGDYAFPGSNANAIIIPDSVKSIGKYAFVDCKNIVSIVIPNGISVIPKNAFTNCEKLESVTIPASIKNIGEYAFAGCENLRSIKLPEGCLSINDYAFTQCRSILSLKIPDSVVFVGKRAFGADLSYDGWGTHQTIFINQEQSAKWHKDWNENCKAKIVHKIG